MKKNCVLNIVFTLCFLPASCIGQIKEGAFIPFDCDAAWREDESRYGDDLNFAIMLDKSSYSSDEVVFINTYLQNNSSTQIWVNNRMLVGDNFAGADLEFSFYSPSGEKAFFFTPQNSDAPERKYFSFLNPGDVIKDNSEGLAYYTFRSNYEKNRSTAYLPGKYCVWAVYHNQTDPGLEGFVWMGKIKSNFVEFEVVAD